MKILHIMAGRGLGGAETYAGDIMLSLHAAGVDQCVVMHRAAPRAAEIAQAGIRMAPEVLAVPTRFWKRLRLKRLLEREKPDLVHCWMRRAASLMPAGTPCPVIGWFGGYYDPRHFGRCTAFVGVTRDIVDHMVRHGVTPEKAHFIPTFPVLRDEPPADRAALGVPPGATAILALSRLHPKKGLDTLIATLPLLPDAFLWLAGEGPLRRALENHARKLGVDSRVKFLGWRTDRGALLRAADICALPSRYEPFGTVILEAWAAGTPFVACRSAGPAAHVTDGVDGLLAPVDDVEALAAQIRRLREDAELRRRLIANGYARYQRDYTREAVTKRMLDLYEALTGEFRAAQKAA